MKKLLNLLLLFFAMAFVFSACNKEVLPVADFIYTIDGLDVTFEDASTDATSYDWDFGDGNSSASASPSHSYAAEGSYTVTLTVSNEDGDDSRSEEITVAKPSIVIDGNFDEWAEYDTYLTGPGGTLLEAQVTAKNGFLFFLIKATADAGPIIQVYFDADNDGATGWDFWGAYETPGLEYLLEYPITEPDEPSAAGLFIADGEDWPWNTTVSDNSISESTGWVTVGNEKVIEFSVAQSLMPDLANTVRISFMNMSEDWEEAGSLPVMWQDPPNPLVPITLF